MKYRIVRISSIIAWAALLLCPVQAFAFRQGARSYVPPKLSEAKSAGAVAAVKQKTGARAQMVRGMAALRAKSGAGWRVQLNKLTGRAAVLTGSKSGKLSGTPAQAAGVFIAENADLLGTDGSDLTKEDERTRKNKNHIRYTQHYRGIPVERSETTVHLTAANEVQAVFSRYRPGISLDVTPAVTADAAFTAVAAAMRVPDPSAVTKSETRLVILPGDDGNYYLCWKVNFFAEEPLGQWVHYVDAHTGSIVEGFNDLRFDTSGTVQGTYFPQYGTDLVCTGPFANEYVTVNGDQQTTGSAGTYTSAQSGTVTSSLTGPWVKAINADMSAVSYSGAAASWTWDYPTTDSHFEETQLFYHMNFIHDYFKNVHGLSVMDYQMKGTVHVGTNYNNAYYSPSAEAIYFGDGDGVSYRSFAREAGVIYHEYTHAVQDHLYYMSYSGQSGAMMEAWSDYFGASIFNEPLIGSYACVSGYFRNLDNTKKYPGDWVGEVHDDSEIYSGALWDIRKTLGATLTDTITFDAWDYLPYDFETGLQSMLLSDDDDGDLSNGTPHKSVIEAAFAAHGITEGMSINNTWEESNDLLATAYGPLVSGTTYYPYIYNIMDSDYFKINAQAGSLAVTMRSIPADCDYDLYVYDASGNQIASSIKASNADESISISVAQGTYYINVISYSGFSTTQAYALTVTCLVAPSDTTPPTGTPGPVTDEGAYGLSTLKFSWTPGTCADPESGISGYYLEVGTAPAANNTYASYLGNVLTRSIIGCAAGKTYYARVRARNGNGLYSDWSANSDGITVDVSSPVGSPSTPTDNGADAVSSRLDFSWNIGSAADPESDIAGYWLQVSSAIPATASSLVYDSYVDGVLSKTVNVPYNYTTYYARVRARNGAGSYSAWSGWSDGIYVHLPAPPAPGVPAPARAYATNAIVFSWAAPADASEVGNYELAVATAADAPAVYDMQVGNVLSYTAIGDFVTGRKYYGRVRSINTVGLCSDWVAGTAGVVVDTTPPAGLPYVRDGIEDDVRYTSSYQLAANWQASTDTVSGVARYWYCVGLTPGATSVLDWTDIGVNTSFTRTDLTLAAGIKYYVGVKTENGAGLFCDQVFSDGQTCVADGPRVSISIPDGATLGTGRHTLNMAFATGSGFMQAVKLWYVPAGGTPVSVAVSGSGLQWTGTMDIESATPDGSAQFIFYGIDTAGVFGTQITQGGNFAVNTAVTPAAGGTVSNADGTSVAIPAGAVDGSIHVRITGLLDTDARITAAAASLSGGEMRPLAGLNLAREFTATLDASGTPVTLFNLPVRITLAYPDTDRDGIVDGTTVKARNLQVCWLNESLNRWEVVPGVSRDSANRTVSVPVTHFSVYALMSVVVPTGVDGIKAYPNPCRFRSDGYTRIDFIPVADEATVYIYTIAGELVRTLNDDAEIFRGQYSKQARWDGRNDDGEAVASGVYLVLTKTSGGIKKEKIAVFW